MIYLDNSATTYPKPSTVSAAVTAAVRSSANPGRSGHAPSLAAASSVYSARTAAAEFFGCDNEERVIFTPGCTISLNMAIKGLLKKGDHVVVSSMEHNAVMRPLYKLTGEGISFTKAEIVPCDNDKTVDSFRKAINGNTKMIICTHASNVWGLRMPVERLCALAHAYGLLFVVDAAQSAGIAEVDMKNGYDAVCAAGHKGLYGPMGTGLLILGEGILPDTIIEGGTGSSSADLRQPDILPDRYESGTPDLSGIAGLKAGIEFVKKKGTDKIFAHELALIQYLYSRLDKLPGIKLYTPFPDPEFTLPLLSFNIEGLSSEEAALRLSKAGIAVRAGLHCAPLAHESMGTSETGAVRISPSVFTTGADIDRLIFFIKKML